MNERKKILEQKKNFLQNSNFRNSFPIYASTIGNDEASEADDVFNERAELSLFRDKKMNSHENEVIKIKTKLIKLKEMQLAII